MRNEDLKMEIHDEVADLLAPHFGDKNGAGFVSINIVDSVQFLLNNYLAEQKKLAKKTPGLTVERIDQIAELCLKYSPATKPGRFTHGLEELWAGWVSPKTSGVKS